MSTAPADTFWRNGDLVPARTAPSLDGRLKDLLAGKKIVMTGVTGFIGEQLLWKILTELPETTPSVLVRRKGSATAYDRVLSLLKKPIFAELRDAAGGAAELLDARIEVIQGDLPSVPELPADLDVVVHCAGDVSFDPPIDQAFTTNVIGTKALMDRMIDAVREPDGSLRTIPHYVHISTAYTAGRRRGAIPEAAHVHTIDYDAETEAGLRMRELVEAESRTSTRLAALRKQAEREHRRAGHLTTAADTERRRLAWVQAELVKAGTERARSLGWTDVYTFTKALAERVVADRGAQIRVSVVRPAIVESSWKHPYPGWIEGFKMAEPLILAYGRGELPEFPASPDSVLDIVPCDHVVNAIVAVAATTPAVGEPVYYHVNSGARNPLTFNHVYRHIRSYFSAHPLENSKGPVTNLPEWQFPGAGAVERVMVRTEKAYALADWAISQAPRSDWTRHQAREIDRARARIEFLKRYHLLYVEYAQSELHFVDDNTLALTRALHAEDVDAFAFDTAVFDWKTYIEDVHCPAVTSSVRRMDALRRKHGNRPTTMRDLTKDSAGAAAVAIFDLDGTIMSTNVIEQYLWARLPEHSPAGQLGEVAQVVQKLPGYLLAERRDRGSFLRAVYRRYRGLDLAELERRIDTTMTPHIMSRISAEALDRIHAHRAAGHTTILMTGVVRPFTRPLHDLFDVIVAADLETASRRPLHRLPHQPAAGRRVARGLAAPLRRAPRHRPDPQLRLRRLPPGPADAVHRRQPGSGQSRHLADAGREPQPVVDRGVEGQAEHSALVPAEVAATSPPARSWPADPLGLVWSPVTSADLAALSTLLTAIERGRSTGRTAQCRRLGGDLDRGGFRPRSRHRVRSRRGRRGDRVRLEQSSARRHQPASGLPRGRGASGLARTWHRPGAARLAGEAGAGLAARDLEARARPAAGPVRDLRAARRPAPVVRTRGTAAGALVRGHGAAIRRTASARPGGAGCPCGAAQPEVGGVGAAARTTRRSPTTGGPSRWTRPGGRSS